MTTGFTAEDLTKPVSQFITTVGTAIRADLTVAKAFEDLRSRTLEQKIIYFYVVDQDNRLIGVVPTRKLLLADPARSVGELVEGAAISIRETTSLQDALELFSARRLLALPVVDHDGQLLGAIDVQLYAEEALDLAESRRLHDMFQLMGVSVQQLRLGTARASFLHRMPWLLCNLAGGIVCAVVAAHFRDVLDKVLLLAMFIPLVLSMSESISIQSMTLTLYHLHGATPWRRLLRRLGLESRTAFLLGAASAVAVAITALFWQPGLLPVVAIATSILAAMFVAAMVGMLLPAALHALKLDPKVAAGPMVLALGDVAATAMYLGLANWWLLAGPGQLRRISATE